MWFKFFTFEIFFIFLLLYFFVFLLDSCFLHNTFVFAFIMSTERENITLKTVDSYVLLFPLVDLTVFFLLSLLLLQMIL